MAGFLLARAGVDVLVIERHREFLDDFRGDMIHPSTMEAIDQLGLLSRFLSIPHQRTPQFVVEVGERRFPMVDFSHLPTRRRSSPSCRNGTSSHFIVEDARR